MSGAQAVLIVTEDSDTESQIVAWLLAGEMVSAPDETASAYIDFAEDTLRICAELEPNDRDMAWVRHLAGVAGGGITEPYEQGVDCFVVGIADDSPMAEKSKRVRE